MATHKIFVEDAEKMGRELNAATNALNDLSELVKKWRQTLTEEMGGIWEGDDYDKFRKDFERDIEGFDQTEQKMRQVLRAAQKARFEYEAMEGDIASLNIARA